MKVELSALATATLWFLLVWLIASATVGLGYRRALREPAPPDPPTWPRFGVLVPLRGADPYLAEALRSVLAQDYPDFELRVVVDSANDPAWPIAARVLEEAPPDLSVGLTALRERRQTCSLCCSNLLQGLEELSPACELVTVAAADTLLPRDWLRRLARRMADPQVGTTLGNRWYLPPPGSMGGLVRQLWNAGAVPFMWYAGIPWSGAMAHRRAALEEGRLAEVWARSMVEDVSLVRPLRASGQRLAFAPELFVVNREATDLPGLWRFLRRQLLWTRLYHPGWHQVLFNAACTLASLVLPCLAVGEALVRGDLASGAAVVAGCGLQLLGLGLAIMLIQQRLAPRLGVARQEARMPLRGLPRLLVGMLLSQAIYVAVVAVVAVTRRVSWRGADYEVLGPERIRLLRDEAPTTLAPGVSL